MRVKQLKVIVACTPTCLIGVGINERRFFLGDLGVDSVSLVKVSPVVTGGLCIDPASESILLKLQIKIKYMCMQLVYIMSLKYNVYTCTEWTVCNVHDIYLNFGRIRFGVEPTKLLGVRATVSPLLPVVVVSSLFSLSTVLLAAFTTVVLA